LFKQIEIYFFFIFIILTKYYPVSNSYFGVKTTGFPINGFIKEREEKVKQDEV